MTVEFFDAKPPDSDTPLITFYVSGLDRIERIQQTNVTGHDTISGSPGSTTAGLEPGDLLLRGFWRGTKASDMASRLRDDALDATGVERLELQAGDSNGSVTSPYDGTYRIADESRVVQPDSKRDQLWQYRLILIED